MRGILGVSAVAIALLSASCTSVPKAPAITTGPGFSKCFAVESGAHARKMRAKCPAGTVLTGGGCSGQNEQIFVSGSFPIFLTNEWMCVAGGGPGNINAVAVCCEAAGPVGRPENPEPDPEPMEVEQETPTSEPQPGGGGVRPPVKLETPLPPCTRDARAAKVQGAVVLQMVVTKDGGTRDVRILKGELPMDMKQAVVDSAKDWRFRPATRNGEPVEVYYNLTFNIGCK